jgi:hypothetical protein
MISLASINERFNSIFLCVTFSCKGNKDVESVMALTTTVSWALLKLLQMCFVAFEGLEFFCYSILYKIEVIWKSSCTNFFLLSSPFAFQLLLLLDNLLSGLVKLVQYFILFCCNVGDGILLEKYQKSRVTKVTKA